MGDWSSSDDEWSVCPDIISMGFVLKYERLGVVEAREVRGSN